MTATRYEIPFDIEQQISLISREVIRYAGALSVADIVRAYIYLRVSEAILSESQHDMIDVVQAQLPAASFQSGSPRSFPLSPASRSTP
jgi:hypothetical protein